ncbi:MAG: nucleoside deaminase [Gemmatimonadales bacterium]
MMIIASPAWLGSQVDEQNPFEGDDEAMAFAVKLAGLNLDHGTGGPFAALVLDGGGRIIGAGVNQVVPERSSVLHAEITAILVAQRTVGSHTLADAPGPCTLAASCDPCAMCLGATLWSGVRRLITGASGEDARRVGFDEGPVFRESWRYIEERGIEVRRGLRREEAAAVLDRYAREGGTVY